MAVLQQVMHKAMVLSMRRSAIGGAFLVHSKEFRDLFDAVSQMNAAECSFDLYEQLSSSKQFINAQFSPVVYMEIRENQHLTAGVFTVRENREIPLHDHPGMHGMLKVVHGKVRIRSFSYLNESQRQQLTDAWNSKSGNKPIRKLFKESVNRWEEKYVVPVIEHEERTMTVGDPPAVLTPNRFSIHRVQALDEPAAFFDILMPPYYPPDPSRDCHYFKMLQPLEKLAVDAAAPAGSALRQHLSTDDALEQQLSLRSQTENVAWLCRIQPPRSYFCNPVDYRGPALQMPTEMELMEEVRKASAE